MIALYAGVCWRCEHTWPIGADIVFYRGVHIHAACAPGGDDE